MKKINVLIFPAGSEAGLEINDAIKNSVLVNVFGLSSISDQTEVAYNYFSLSCPNINNDDFLDFFKSYIIKNNINIVFSTHDTVSLKLAKISSQLNAFLVNSDIFTNEITRSKFKTYDLFFEESWCPFFYSEIKDLNCDSYPVIVKPDEGQGGQQVTLCESEEELNIAISKINYPVIVEYLPGEEITVDCYTDKYGEIIHLGPRERNRIRGGITMRSSSVYLSQEIETIAKKINEKLSFHGPWFFQLKKNKAKNWKLLEISARPAGTMVYQRASGVNVFLMTIYDYLGYSLDKYIQNNIVIDRRITTKIVNVQFDAIYLDFDDTIIVNSLVNFEAMAFIYKYKNKNKEIYLLTRHSKDIYETLNLYNINYKLFDNIFVLSHNEKKSNYIHPDKKSIFIDNSFFERQEVFNNTKSLVYDVNDIGFFI